MEANNTGGQGSRRAVAPSDDDDNTAFEVLPNDTLTHCIDIMNIITNHSL